MMAADLSFADQHGVSGSTSDTPPTHYILKIDSFSLLTKNNERYTSAKFEAGGYDWKLVLHPNGNKNKGVTDHISLYLLLVSPPTTPGWEVRALFRLFLLNHSNYTYFTLKDTADNGRWFHSLNLEWGFDKFIPHAAFKDPANGYLVNDTCVFGAEVYVCQETLIGKGESLSMIKDPITYKNTWRIANFSTLTEECLESKPFNAADHKWKIQFYPRGRGSATDNFISMYLTLAEPKNLPPVSKIYAEFTLRILDQTANPLQCFCKTNDWFSASNSSLGWPRFLSLDKFKQWAKYLVVNDLCIVEAEINVLAVAKAL
ncbi:Speckle-type POZ protein SPOP [Handroanthus impetiginosus]|uniref:Speckle-type POZ protein SPOP n=1 Tax=Handroanthus impetiginosus TaxID=429701 RepID=A0A2G9HKN5_9LAMI|nr:Speckle-type POZ protein SPOP [Handroanthus impetiginosus]PIN18096.1 Speckle-type POZ protein SPOP [Handroanthus impetiginosus]